MEFHDTGYEIITLDLDDAFCDNLILDMIFMSSKLQEQGYHYNESPRQFQLWQHSRFARKLAQHPQVISHLKTLFKREPIPFQTINFKHGSNQPLHSDTIHFHTEPAGWLAGVWVALEDISDQSGPLHVVPGSHTLPYYNFTDFGIPIPKPGEQFEAYKKYEERIAELVYGLPRTKFTGKRRQALIWTSNLLHGGAPILDEVKSRFSQVTHYFFEGCEKYYIPMFSPRGEYYEKDLSKSIGLRIYA